MNLSRLIVILFFVTSCISRDRDNKVQYVNGRQLFSPEETVDEVDNPLVGIISPKTVSIGEEFLARIFLKRSDLKLIDAFIDCDSVTRPSVDTTNYDVSGCRKGLVVKDDTIRIGFRPTSPGIKKIEGITILTRDSNRVFKIIKYSFTYTTHASMYFDNNVVGIWTNGSGPNASFSITEDSIYYVEHSTSIKYEQAGDSIVFFFDENIIVRSKAYRIDKDTLIIESSQGRAKYWKFTD